MVCALCDQFASQGDREPARPFDGLSRRQETLRRAGGGTQTQIHTIVTTQQLQQLVTRRPRRVTGTIFKWLHPAGGLESKSEVAGALQAHPHTHTTHAHACTGQDTVIFFLYWLM